MNKLSIVKKASLVRKKLNVSVDSPIDLFTMINNIPNMTVMYYPMGENISGICIKDKEIPLIAINSSMSIGRQHFSLAHELYHFYFDKDDKVNVSDIDIRSKNEKDANQFASYLLIPMNSLIERIEEIKEITINDIIKLEQYYKVSRQAILVRLLEEEAITSIQKNDFSTKVISTAVNLGYDDALYRPSPVEKAYRTYGKYIKLVDELQQMDKITIGKYEELLLSAYRTDLVYGDESEQLND